MSITRINGCLPYRWSRSGSVIWDHSDHGRSNEAMNPIWRRFHLFILSTIIQVISDHWSWSGSSHWNAPKMFVFYPLWANKFGDPARTCRRRKWNRLMAAKQGNLCLLCFQPHAWDVCCWRKLTDLDKICEDVHCSSTRDSNKGNIVVDTRQTWVWSLYIRYLFTAIMMSLTKLITERKSTTLLSLQHQ